MLGAMLMTEHNLYFYQALMADLRSAIAGLPEDTTPLWDGGLTMSRVDLDKLGA